MVALADLQVVRADGFDNVGAAAESVSLERDGPAAVDAIGVTAGEVDAADDGVLVGRGMDVADGGGGGSELGEGLFPAAAVAVELAREDDVGTGAESVGELAVGGGVAAVGEDYVDRDGFGAGGAGCAQALGQGRADGRDAVGNRGHAPLIDHQERGFGRTRSGLVQAEHLVVHGALERSAEDAATDHRDHERSRQQQDVCCRTLPGNRHRLPVYRRCLAVSSVVRHRVEAWARAMRGGQGPFKQAVQGERSGSPDHECEGDRDGKDVILEAFTLLVARPVHEHTIRGMHQKDRDRHDDGDAEGGNPREQAE